MINEKFWLAIAFLSFFILAIKYVWPLIAKKLDNKSKQIEDEILSAKELKQTAEKLLINAKKYYEESVTFAQKLIEDAKIEAQSFAKESQELLEQEVRKKTTAALDRIKTEEEAAIREIKSKIVLRAIDDLSNNLNFDQKNQDQLIEKAIKNLES